MSATQEKHMQHKCFIHLTLSVINKQSCSVVVVVFC